MKEPGGCRTLILYQVPGTIPVPVPGTWYQGPMNLIGRDTFGKPL
jgi:hypothetical protein